MSGEELDGIEFDNGPALNQEIEQPEPEPASDPPTATTEEPPKEVQQGDDQQALLARYAITAREAKRKADALEQKLKELESNSAPQVRPDVPQMPDPLSLTDDQYRQQVAARDEAVRRAAEFDAKQRLLQEQQRQIQAERERQQQESLVKKAETYKARSVQLGVKPEELEQAGKMVATFGIDGQLAELILADDHGPLITKYLATNLTVLDEINSLTPLQAAVRIATDIKQKAAAMKPKASSAPEPPNRPKSGGAIPRANELQGWTFE